MKKLILFFALLISTPAFGQVYAWNASGALTTPDTITAQTLTNITPLAFTVGANQKWWFDFFLADSAFATGGSQYGILLPDTSCRFRAKVFGTGGSITAYTEYDITASNTATAQTYTTAVGYGLVEIRGVVTTGASTSGTLAAQALKVTSGSIVYFAPGTYFTATRLQ